MRIPEYEKSDGMCFGLRSDIVVVACKDLVVGIESSDGRIVYEIETNDEAISLTSLGDYVRVGVCEGMIALIEGEEGTLLWRNQLRFFSLQNQYPY